ncbi:MAG: DUF2490 domain-containing protein [Myxococcota bacterium]
MSAWYLNPVWSVWFDTHYNTGAFFVTRGGLTYNFQAGPRITAGFAHLLLDNGNDELLRNELRPWAQAFIPVRFDDAWSFSQRIRTDFRFREELGADASGFDFTFRLRLQSVLSYRFAQTAVGRPLVQVADEVLVNLFGEAGPNFLDQNRISLLVGLETPPWTFRVGYLHRFIPGASGLVRTHEHNAVVWVNYVFRRKGRRLPLTEEGNP